MRDPLFPAGETLRLRDLDAVADLLTDVDRPVLIRAYASLNAATTVASRVTKTRLPLCRSRRARDMYVVARTFDGMTGVFAYLKPEQLTSLDEYGEYVARDDVPDFVAETGAR
jgi:hypothetical protein